MNPFLEKFNTPFETIPFDKIKNEHFLPAFKQLIAETEVAIDKIVQNKEAATFENTIEALEYCGLQLDVLSNAFFNLNSAETNDEIQNIAQEVSPLLTEHASKISQNEALFARVKKVYDECQTYTLDEEQQMLLKETYKGFVRSGALLNEADKAKLKEINKALSLKSLQFGQNALASTNAYFKHITDEKDLAGIPKTIVAQYAEEAKSRALEGWVVTLQYPSYVPFMTYAENRALRQELSLANGQKSFKGGTYDNQELIKELINLRKEKAQLLGYKSYADYVLEERMAKTPEHVYNLLNELQAKAKPFAEKEIDKLRTLAKADGIENMQSFDHAYYAEKLRKQKFDLSDEELKPYFPLEQVQQAVFSLAEKLFGLTFEERTDIPVYHSEVKTYEVKENGAFKAILYTDYFPRKGKRAGAWMTDFKSEYRVGNTIHQPQVSIVCNFNKPGQNTPSLLTHREVTTLFHETGHAIHGMLANTKYPGLSGTSVKWDFVELPSQFLENYAYEKEFLKTFAKHYETGEALSDEKIEKLELSKNFMEGYQTLRQVGFGLLDMAYHTHPEQVKEVKAFEDAQLASTALYPTNPKTAMSPTFSHIFQGGYSAGYYSYKWAEVLDADAFAYFVETGIFNPETAAKYKKLLAAGGTVEPMKLYEEFRGRQPQVDSLLKRAFG